MSKCFKITYYVLLCVTVVHLYDTFHGFKLPYPQHRVLRNKMTNFEPAHRVTLSGINSTDVPPSSSRASMEEKLGRFTNVAKKDAGESIEIEKTTNYYTSTYCAAGIAVNSKFLKADNFDVKGHGVG